MAKIDVGDRSVENVATDLVSYFGPKDYVMEGVWKKETKTKGKLGPNPLIEQHMLPDPQVSL